MIQLTDAFFNYLGIWTFKNSTKLGFFILRIIIWSYFLYRTTSFLKFTFVFDLTELSPHVKKKNLLLILPSFKINFFIQKCYVQLFCTYSFCLYFFGKRKLSKKAACKTLLKLTEYSSVFHFHFRPNYFAAELRDKPTRWHSPSVVLTNCKSWWSKPFNRNSSFKKNKDFS